jgi:predicted DNA repair protein MutK
MRPGYAMANRTSQEGIYRMAGGLVALLDDIAAIAKLAAASLDDVAAASAKAGSKAVGVVIDDTAVTPRYVTGLSPARELPIIWKIALGSLRNKLLILLPAALVLSAFAPWAITPILMIGGAYLCFEASEKILEAFTGGQHGEEACEITDPKQLEDRQVAGAIRTDLILSGEIMAIALAELSGQTIVNQAIALALVGVAITAGVYGVVALIVKMDDIGLSLAKRSGAAVQAFGRGLVTGMPMILKALSTIGTAAMLWVGGQIIVHGLEHFHLTPLPGWIHHASEAAGHAVPALGAVIEWIVYAALSAVVGIVIGGAIVGLLHLKPKKH